MAFTIGLNENRLGRMNNAKRTRDIIYTEWALGSLLFCHLHLLMKLWRILPSAKLFLFTFGISFLPTSKGRRQRQCFCFSTSCPSALICFSCKRNVPPHNSIASNDNSEIGTYFAEKNDIEIIEPVPINTSTALFSLCCNQPCIFTHLIKLFHWIILMTSVRRHRIAWSGGWAEQKFRFNSKWCIWAWTHTFAMSLRRNNEFLITRKV